MGQETVVSKWGESSGIRMPDEVIRKANISLNDILVCDVDADGRIILSKHANADSDYKCYFDASFGPYCTRGAYLVYKGNELVKSDSFELNVPTSSHAEAAALHSLLEYIGTSLPPGSAVRIFGDCASVLKEVTKKKSRHFRDTRAKYRLIKQGRELSLNYIPREQNRDADKLSHLNAPSRNKRKKLKAGEYRLQVIQSYLQMKSMTERRFMRLSNIKVPQKFLIAKTPEKLSERHDYFIRTGKLPRAIEVDKEMRLVDGYTSYLILSKFNIPEWEVTVKKPVSAGFVRLSTERLLLKDFTLRDLDDMFEIFGDEETMEHIEPPYTKERTKRFLADFCMGKDPKPAYAAMLKDTFKVIGYILFKPLESPDVYELGFIFNKGYWRKGYAYEMCSALIEHGFGTMKLSKIVAETEDTKRALPLILKLGLRPADELTEDGLIWCEIENKGECPNRVAK